MKTIKKNLYACMFSGGRTSAFMAKFIKEYEAFDNVIYIYMNTGKELEETLIFVNQCDKIFELNLVWLEAKVNSQKGKGTIYKVVNFKTASRKGEPFYDMLKKFPLPNFAASNCTRELKKRPIDAYLRQFKKQYKVFKLIGIRADEQHRKSLNAGPDKIIYPLCDIIKVDNNFIRSWWSKQSFDLNLKDYQNNCDLCFKKSLNKRLTIVKENPKIADWWLDMENKFSTDKTPRFDLRTNISIADLVSLSKRPFKKAVDLFELSQNQIDLFEFETDCFCKSS